MWSFFFFNSKNADDFKLLYFLIQCILPCPLGTKGIDDLPMHFMEAAILSGIAWARTAASNSRLAHSLTVPEKQNCLRESRQDTHRLVLRKKLGQFLYDTRSQEGEEHWERFFIRGLVNLALKSAVQTIVTQNVEFGDRILKIFIFRFSGAF